MIPLHANAFKYLPSNIWVKSCLPKVLKVIQSLIYNSTNFLRLTLKHSKIHILDNEKMKCFKAMSCPNNFHSSKGILKILKGNLPI